MSRADSEWLLEQRKKNGRVRTTEWRNTAVARGKRRERRICRSTEAMDPEKSAAISLEGVSRAEDMLKLVPSTSQADLVSAKEPRTISPQNVPDKSDDVEADRNAAASPVATGSNLSKSETEHSATRDVNAFPILCYLDKDDRGVYTLSGICCLCDETFRAVGNVAKGTVLPWNGHATLQHRIVQHARTHGAVGYTPHRNLDEMRLDWVRSPKGKKIRGSKHKTHGGARCREHRCTQCGVYQTSSAFRRTKRKRVGICRTCEAVPCAACGTMLPLGKFTDSDVYRYFSPVGAKHITCRVCKEQQQERRLRLHKLMKTSRRKACTCKHPQAHTRTCPLRIRFDGDRPYPGCDVMSRADSEWLLEQRRINGRVRAT